VYVCALGIELRIDAATSLKAKRTVVRHLVDTARQRYGVAAAEVGHQDLWQRSELGFAAVGSSARHVEDVLDNVERFVWSHPEVTVLSAGRHWVETAE